MAFRNSVLLAARIPLDAANTHGDTALHLAVRARCRQCAGKLIAAKASISVRNADGLSAPDVARLTSDKALASLFN